MAKRTPKSKPQAEEQSPEVQAKTLPSTPVSTTENPRPRQPKADEDDQKRIDDFMREVVRLRTQREEDEKPKPVPGLTSKQQAQLELEQEAGRRAVARHAELDKTRPQPKVDSLTTPVFVPENYVPDMNSKSDEERGYTTL